MAYNEQSPWTAVILQPFCLVLFQSAKCALLKSTGGEVLMDDSTLDRMEDSYWKCHAFLASTLRSITQNRNVPYLDALAADFNQTLPTQSKSTTYL